jgi:ankyrin repeat protein
MVVRIGSLLLALVALFGGAAHADWYVSGIQYKCDTAAGTFEILPYTQSSSGDDAIQEGFVVAKDGRSLHACWLGKRRLLAQLHVVPPQPRGACMGGGAAGVPSISVDGVELDKKGISIDWSCWNSDAPTVERVEVKTAPKGVSITECTSTFDGDGTRHDQPCETRIVDVDANAAAFDKIDHDLANAATQAAEAAILLPADFDMAKAFAGQTDPNGLPSCAHWVGYFLRLSGDPQTWGRIGGKPHQRASIHPVYPAVCTRASDHACDASAYVIAGDRVDVDFVCGAWTKIRYLPRVRAFPQTIGWVETARLYGLQDLPKPRPVDPNMLSNDPAWKQPLRVAALKNDAKAIAQLVRNGADPNGGDRAVAPLSVALGWNRLAAIAALLGAGADPDPGVSDWNRWGLSALMQVADMDRAWHYRDTLDPSQIGEPVALAKLLLQHGAKLEATDIEGASALFHAIGANNVDIAAFLIAAGADVNRTRGGEGAASTASDGRDAGYTPLMAALSAYDGSRDPSMIRLFLARGADPNFMTDKEHYNSEEPSYAGETILTISAREGYMTIVLDLLAYGADPTLARGDGALPAEIAREAGFPEIAKLIAGAAQRKAQP